jgi:hypothetical protein
MRAFYLNEKLGIYLPEVHNCFRMLSEKEASKLVPSDIIWVRSAPAEWAWCYASVTMKDDGKGPAEKGKLYFNGKGNYKGVLDGKNTGHRLVNPAKLEEILAANGPKMIVLTKKELEEKQTAIMFNSFRAMLQREARGI